MLDSRIFKRRIKRQEPQRLSSERVAKLRLVEHVRMSIIVIAKAVHLVDALQFERPMAVGLALNERFFAARIAVGGENVPPIAHGLRGVIGAPGLT